MPLARALPLRRPPARTLPPLVVLLLLPLAATPARAQCQSPDGSCDDGGGTGGNNVPTVHVSPLDMRTSQPGGLQVTVTMSDDVGLVDSTFHVYVNGQDATSTFAYSRTTVTSGPVRSRATATGMVRLSEASPTAVVTARVCDNASVRECVDSDAATYTLSLPGVEVSPDGGTASVNGGEWVNQTFTVRNRGTEPAAFALRAECLTAPGSTPFTTSCTLPAGPSLTLNPGTSAVVSVQFSTGSAGGTGTVRLTALHSGNAGVQDAGWVDMAVVGRGTARSAPVVNTLPVDPGTSVERSLCVAASAGAGAAYECGDLRLAHPLPAVQTYGRARAPVLIYNSQHAHPRPIVYANVTLPAGSAQPDTVRADLRLWNGVVVSRSWSGSEWQGGTTRRIAVQFDGLALATAIYGYSLQVTTVYGGARYPAAEQPGQTIVVNRRNSPYGPGWWVAGLEQIIQQPNGSFVWVGGDGSTRLYGWVAPGTYVPASVAQPDTLIAPGPGTDYYVRRLRGGAQVRYNTSGQHVETRNRLQHVTRFHYYNTWTPLLDRVVVPSPGTDEVYYRFIYDQHTGRLTAFDAPGVPGISWGRRYGYVYQAAAGVDSIRDPDNHLVRFGYGAASHRVVSRTDRRGTVTAFGYDAAGKLASASVNPGGGAAVITQRYESLEGKGLVTSVGPVQAYTRLDGPRTDVSDHTYLWLDRWGAPVRIRDALGAETVIRRGDAAYPALVTEVVAPGGLRTTAAYDARGRVDRTVVHDPLGDGRGVLTTYAYDDRWDAPTRVATYAVEANGATSPLTGTASTEYDAAGNAVWTQQGDASRRVHFRYYASGPAAGQLRAVQAPATAAGTAVDSLAYDALGNVSATVSPAGFLTLHYRDALGRDTLTITPTDSAGARTVQGLLDTGVRRVTRYDAMGRDTLSVTRGPALSWPSRGHLGAVTTPEQAVSVRTRYDAEGQPLEVARWATPDEAGVDVLYTWFEYDAGGRKITERDSTQLQRFAYDASGNVTAWTTGRGHVITTRYDALGRATRREVPQVSYSRTCVFSEPGTCTHPVPRYPNGGSGGMVIPEEWTYFRYDSAGNMVHAENADAIVERAYYRNGALRTDLQRLRSYATADFTQHVYGVDYEYDLAGRTTAVRHPANLAGSAQADRYTYDPLTGALRTGTDRFGNVFSFTHDAAGRLTALAGPNFTDTNEYDLEGRTRRRLEVAAGVTLHDERFRYDGRGKVLDVNNGDSDHHQWYTGLGMLAGTDWENHADFGYYAEELRTDALGNVYWKRSGGPGQRTYYAPFVTRYAPGHARVAIVEKVEPETPGTGGFYGDRSWRGYDAGGNVQSGGQEVNGPLGNGTVGLTQQSRSRSFYGADQRLRYYQENAQARDGDRVVERGVWEEYRYDALGRRVMVRSNRADLCSEAEVGKCVSHITRFVWSGDQLLWELRAAGSGGSLEGAYTDGPYHGRVSYFHAGGIDRPLSIWKAGYPVILPHQNWRGQFAKGTYTSGQLSDCTPTNTVCTPIAWPGHRTTAWHEQVENAPDIRTWHGGLVDGMRDATGQMYMRNRYYDPATGQFTQMDPIGLAGGLNAYGFAAGDPVTYSDPYGLCWQLWRPECRDKAAGAVSSVTKPVFQATANFAAGFTENLVGVEEGTPEIDRDSRLYSAGRSFSDMVSGLGPEMNRYSPDGGGYRARPGNESPGRLTNAQSRELAEYVGYNRQARDVPFNSRNQPVYTNGRNYITPDVDSHNGGVWKMFDRSGNRLGTYDAALNRIGK